jgi:DNA helicase-2/ATP-dependent DNA helicase PcrA
MIAQKHGHITVVGDDDQSIYRFRGAYLTNIAEFKKLFPRYVEKPLEQNYRSTKNILAVANKLIENKPERTVKKLFTNNHEGEKVSIIETETDDDQANFILKTIKELLKKYSMKDIAILCRRRVSADMIIEALRKHNIPFQFVGESGFFQEPIIKDVVAYLKVIDNPADNGTELVRILHRDIYSIKRVDIAEFNRYAKENDITTYEAFDHLDDMKVDKKRFSEVKKAIDDLIKSKNKLKLIELVHKLLFETDFYRFEIASDNKRNILLMNQFYKFVEEYDRLYQNNDIDDLIDYLEYASGFEIEEETADEFAINISTIHGVKGMEFPVVIIPDVVGRKMPMDYKKDKFGISEDLLKGVKSEFDDKEIHLQEERRLMYVAMTRAKEKLFITYAKRYGDNIKDSKISKFLEEVDYETNKNINFESVEVGRIDFEEASIEKQIHTMLLKETVSALRMNDFNDAIEKILLMAKAINEDMDIRKEVIAKIKEPDYSKIIKQIKNGSIDKEKLVPSKDLTFSYSQLSTYKRCPKIYLYRYLLKVPPKPRYYFQFGADIHTIVEELSKMIKEGRKVDYKIALEILKRNWKPKGYKSRLDEKRDYDEAKEILKIFLKEQENMTTEIIDIERPFMTEIDGIKVGGRIDRIDKDGTEYIVIDYKTAKTATSANEIKKDLQLILYSLVTEHLYNKRPKKICIWFLRLNKKVFVDVEDESIESIKMEIKEIVNNIMNENFDPNPGWECRNCDYDCLCDECKR